MFFFPIASSFAEESSADSAKSAVELDQLLGLDLEELVVNIASKRGQKLKNAPGIISVITAEDIERYGANDLQDLLSRLPNVHTHGTSISAKSITSIRGQSRTFLDNQILLAIDGRPLRENQTGGLNSGIYGGIPLEAIERIEVIRGPGSVLYGTNAFSGVINIVLKDVDHRNESLLGIGYGSSNTTQTSGVYTGESHDWKFLVSGKFLQSDGWDFNATDENGTRSSIDLSAVEYGTLARVQKRGFTATTFFGQKDETTLGSPVTFPGKELFQVQRGFFDGQYVHEVSSKYQAQFNFTYNHFLNQSSAGAEIGSETMLFESSLKGEMFEKVNVVMGATYTMLGDDPGTQVVTWTNRHSFYGQLDYQIFDSLSLLGGLQANKIPGLDYDLSPRYGAILNLTPEIGIKILQSEAFRSPSSGETDVNIPNFKGNKNLKPETINTFDAQIFYTTRIFSTALTYYKSKQKNTIKSVVSGGVGSPVNAGDIDFEGVEWEWRYIPSSNLEMNGSIS